MIKYLEIKDNVLKINNVNVTFVRHYDVIIVGVGTAGVMAMITALKENLSVLGIESLNCLGGTSTAGFIEGRYFGIPGGIAYEIDQELTKYNTRVKSRIEGKKIYLEKMVLDLGGTLSYSSTVVGLYKKRNKIIGVKALIDNKLIDISCEVLIDSTGDAFIAYLAGCKAEFGRSMDGKTQPYTMSNLRKPTPDNYRVTNYDFGRVDQRDEKELSKALIFSRSYEMKEEKNGFDLVYQSQMLGLREGRRIDSLEQIKLKDIFNERFTKTPIFYSWSDLDKHGWDLAFDGETLGDWSIGANLGAFNLTIPISYKTLLPKKIDGLIVACRALGVDRDVSSSTRMVPDMNKCGEAAAYMAKLKIKHHVPLKRIPYSELKMMLEKTKCLGDNKDLKAWIAGIWVSSKMLDPIKVEWIKNENALKEALKTDKPGIAIWSAKKYKNKFTPLLKELVKSDDLNLRINASFALAINNNKEALPILRDTLKRRDPNLLFDSRKHNQRRLFIATYYLGKLKDKDSLDLLISILDKDEYKHSSYQEIDLMTKKANITDFNNILFQELSEATVALIKIGDKYKNLRKKISIAFKKAFENNDFIKNITTRPELSSEYGMCENIKNVAFSYIKKWQR